MIKKIQRSNIRNIIEELHNNFSGKFFGISFLKENGELRNSSIQFGVFNPQNTLKPGTGKYMGESFFEALANGRIKFYDPNKINEKGVRGAYRQCRIERMVSITMDGVRFEIED